MKSCLVFLCVAIAVVVAVEDICIPYGHPYLLADPNHCSGFYVCAYNRMIRMSCNDRVFNPDVMMCVIKGSIWDKCTLKEKASIVCTPGTTGNITHKRKCAQYYDCSDNTESYLWPHHLKECPYQQLFNINTKTCQNYTLVKCGDRVEPISYCDYEINLCRSANCIPCHESHPSCKNLPDGLNPWEGREGSSDYVKCKNNRTVYQGSCAQDDGVYLFDVELRTCVKHVD